MNGTILHPGEMATAYGKIVTYAYLLLRRPRGNRNCKSTRYRKRMMPFYLKHGGVAYYLPVQDQPAPCQCHFNESKLHGSHN